MIRIHQLSNNLKRYSKLFGLIIAMALLSASLTACSPRTLRSPCPHFGKHCTQTPIDGWQQFMPIPPSSKLPTKTTTRKKP